MAWEKKQVSNIPISEDTGVLGALVSFTETGTEKQFSLRCFVSSKPSKKVVQIWEGAQNAEKMKFPLSDATKQVRT